MITVNLPKPRLGSEIAEQFAQCGCFRITDEVRWETNAYHTDSGVVSAESGYSPEVGVVATPLFLTRPGLIARRLFGKSKPQWRSRIFDGETYLTEIRLLPLVPSICYETVRVRVQHVEWVDPMAAGAHVVTDVGHALFAPYRTAFDLIMHSMLENLN